MEHRSKAVELAHVTHRDDSEAHPWSTSIACWTWGTFFSHNSSRAQRYFSNYMKLLGK